MYNKNVVTLNVLNVAVTTSPVKALSVVKLSVERGQTRSTSYVLRETSAEFSLHAGNMKFGTRNEGVK